MAIVDRMFRVLFRKRGLGWFWLGVMLSSGCITVNTPPVVFPTSSTTTAASAAAVSGVPAPVTTVAGGTSSTTTAASAAAVSAVPAPVTTSTTEVLALAAETELRSPYSVSYTEEGYAPKKLEVPLGTPVVFYNDSDKAMWPASNIHPSHEILPEFDSMGPIEPGHAVAFVFEKSGYFRYHDHIEPVRGGLINSVGGEPQEHLAWVETADMVFGVLPPDFDISPFVDVYNDDGLLSDFLFEYGPEATIELLQNLDYLTGRFCHDRAHEVGRLAYERWGPMSFALDLHGCQSGAIHGATEALLSARGTATLEADINVLCSQSDNSFTLHQCLHGVGHGLMAWTTYEIHDALELCDVLAAFQDKQSCYSGVFMENGVGGLSSLIGHDSEYLRDDDAHFPCDVVDGEYVAQCYFFQTSHMLKVFNNDFNKVAADCAEVPEVARRECFVSYGRDIGDQTRQETERATVLCGYVSEDISRMHCVSGAVFNWFWQKPEQEQYKVTSYCASLADDPIVQDGCYRTIVEQAGFILPSLEQREHFCSLLDTPTRQQSCLEQIAT